MSKYAPGNTTEGGGARKPRAPENKQRINGDRVLVPDIRNVGVWLPVAGGRNSADVIKFSVLRWGGYL